MLLSLHLHSIHMHIIDKYVAREREKERKREREKKITDMFDALMFT